VAYHKIIHNAKPAAERTLAKDTTTILYVSYVAKRPVKYATSEIKNKNIKLSYIKVILTHFIYSKTLW